MLFKKLLASLLVCFAGVAYADSQTKIVVPFAPGGSADLVARVIAKQYTAQTGKSAIVENRPGAGGHIGGEHVAKSAPDGNTMLLGTMGVHSTYSIYSKLGYNPGTAFKPVIIFVELPHVLVVNPNNPAKTLRDFVINSKGSYKPVNYGSAGIGSSTHLSGELFKIQADVPAMQHIPYKGSALALNDVIAGQIDAMFEQVPTTIQHVNAGKLRALGVTSKHRIASLPNVPTIAEQGYPEYATTAWFSIAVPADTPDAKVKQLNKELNAILKDPAVKAQFQELNLIPVGGSSEFAAKHWASEGKKWKKVIDTANIRE